MDTKEEMLKQAFEKIESGFNCIKFKVGAIDFDEECRMLEAIRKKYSSFNIEIRLDANGAFKNDEALHQLKELSRFDIHSIEQPIKPKQLDLMQELCKKSTIAIALDEELIGVDVERDGKKLLRYINPQFIILKPTLIGGFSLSEKWIHFATEMNIGWWATSALESNIGLNAIAQWTSSLDTNLPQGLGTGGLYSNNIPSPLVVKNGFLFYDVNKSWPNTL
jgi:L-alanine-DL-glutamate epimerase-like enolase superfamily enzyme